MISQHSRLRYFLTFDCCLLETVLNQQLVHGQCGQARYAEGAAFRPTCLPGCDSSRSVGHAHGIAVGENLSLMQAGEIKECRQLECSGRWFIQPPRELVGAAVDVYGEEPAPEPSKQRPDHLLVGFGDGQFSNRFQAVPFQVAFGDAS